MEDAGIWIHVYPFDVPGRVKSFALVFAEMLTGLAPDKPPGMLWMAAGKREAERFVDLHFEGVWCGGNHRWFRTRGKAAAGDATGFKALAKYARLERLPRFEHQGVYGTTARTAMRVVAMSGSWFKLRDKAVGSTER